MRLLRLEISGFKSFCDKTTINFIQNGISVVVGPNGCGKSNIVDAIRWTLGEQSAKHLRGNSMEEVIFNGSNSRQPVNLAQVTLVFSNTGHDTIAKYHEFSEISINRRLYRSGESQYLINKTLCRLSDIRELFMDTGIGGKGYSIIEQGKIDLIITSRAEDRRVIIDEAAGIVKFKTKRKEAERKFAATKQNLLRVEDILNELMRQESTLKEQVAQAEEYHNTKGRLERLQQCIAATRWFQLEKRAQRVSNTKKVNLQQLVEFQVIISNLEAKASTLDLEITSKQAAREDLRTRMQMQKEKVIKLESTLESNKVALDNLSEWQKKNNEEIDLLNKQIKTVAYQINSHEHSAEKFSKEIDGKSDLLEQIKEMQTIKNRVLSEQRLKLENLQKEEITLITQLSGDKNQQAQLRERLMEAGQKQDQLKSQMIKLEDVENKLEIAQEKLSAALTKAVERKEKYQRTIVTLSQEKESLTKKINQIRLNREAYAKEINQAENRYQSLQEIMQNHEEFNTSARKFLDYLDTDPPSASKLGFIGSLAQLIVPPNPATPQSIAFLNRYFNLLVFSSVRNLKNIITTVNQLEIEQLQVYFLDLVSGTSAAESNSLVNRLNCKPELSIDVPIADGYEFVASPMHQFTKDKLQKAQGLVDSSASLMTKEKIFIIGKPGKSNPAELFFNRRTELSTLENKLKKQNLKLQETEKELAIKSTALEETEGSLNRVEEEAVAVDLEIVKLEKEVEAKSLENQQLRNNYHNLLQEQLQIENSMAQFKDRIAKLTDSINKSQQQHKKISQSIQQVTVLIDETEIDRQEESNELQKLQINLASLEEKQQNNVNTIERLKNEDLQRKNQLDELISHSVETKDKKEIINLSLEKTKNILPALLQELSTIEMQLKVHTDKIEVSSTRLSEIEVSRQKEQKNISQLREKNHKLDIQFAQLTQEAKNFSDNLYAENSVTAEELLQTFDVNRFDIKKEEETISHLKQSIGGMENINLAAKNEYDTLKERITFLSTQSLDLKQSIETLEDSINKINLESRRRFRDTFKLVNQQFSIIFPQLFGGGEAYLKLTDETDLLESGVDIIARPPGKKLQNMNLLSGGEKALTAIALVFAVFQTKPSPFCLLDEVDAPLDDTNNIRFNQHVKLMTENSQFIIITHNKRTMEIGNSLLGVTMEEPGISKIVSVNFDKMAADFLPKAG